MIEIPKKNSYRQKCIENWKKVDFRVFLKLLIDLLFKKFKQISFLVCDIQIDCPHLKILKYKTYGERKFII
jgi:hypothetical protein